MSDEIKPIGKNCEVIIKELGIQDYALGKSKVLLRIFLLSLLWKHFKSVKFKKSIFKRDLEYIWAVS